MIPGESAHPSGQPRVRKQPRFTRAGDGEPLLSVERHRSLVGRCVDRHVVGGKATPQLPEVGLDTPYLGWEVVGDQQVGPHRVALLLHGCPTRERFTRAHSACPRSIGSGDSA